MATTKTYKSNSRNLTLFLTIKGRVRSIRFSDMGVTFRYSIFTTSNPHVQAALEASKKFGTEYVLVEEKKVADSPAEAQAMVEQKPVAASYPKVKLPQQAAKILEEKYGVEPGMINSKTDALRYAKEFNIEFPNLK